MLKNFNGGGGDTAGLVKYFVGVIGMIKRDYCGEFFKLNNECMEVLFD